MRIYLKQPKRSTAMDAAKSNALRSVDWQRTRIGNNHSWGGYFDASDLSERIAAFDGRRNESDEEPEEESSGKRSYAKDANKCRECRLPARHQLRVIKTDRPASEFIRDAIGRLQDRLAECLAEEA